MKFWQNLIGFLFFFEEEEKEEEDKINIIINVEIEDWPEIK